MATTVWQSIPLACLNAGTKGRDLESDAALLDEWPPLEQDAS